MREGRAPAKLEKGTALRVEGELLAAIDDYARTIEKRTGVRVARTAAAEALLRLGIRAAKGLTE
jgi:hypothetical protein